MKKHFLICFALLVCLFSYNKGFSQLTLFGSNAPNNNNSGFFTIGNSFTPNINITVTAFRTFWGTQVTLWDNSGTLLATQSVPSAPGSWTTQTALATPVVLTAGQTYVIGAYTNGGAYYWNSARPNTFANGTIGQGVYSLSNSFPTSVDDQNWMVDIVYHYCPTKLLKKG